MDSAGFWSDTGQVLYIKWGSKSAHGKGRPPQRCGVVIALLIYYESQSGWLCRTRVLLVFVLMPALNEWESPVLCEV